MNSTARFAIGPPRRPPRGGSHYGATCGTCVSDDGRFAGRWRPAGVTSIGRGDGAGRDRRPPAAGQRPCHEEEAGEAVQRAQRRLGDEPRRCLGGRAGWRKQVTRWYKDIYRNSNPTAFSRSIREVGFVRL